MSVARFKVEFYDKTAEKEYLSLDGSVRAMVNKGIARLALRADEIGKSLSGLLAGCRELKFRLDGIRVIYRIRDGHVEVVQIIAIGARNKGKGTWSRTTSLRTVTNAPALSLRCPS